MKICCSRQMKEIDEISIRDFGIPGVVLMENAGRTVADIIARDFPDKGSALVLCGTGNNGGDGFVIARHLLSRGYAPTVFICGDPERIKGDARINLEILRRMGMEVIRIDEHHMDMLEQALKPGALVVDALLGTGYTGPLSLFYSSLVKKVNQAGLKVVSVDIPSGLNGDSGFADDCCIKADKTITFQLPKLGLLINDGPEACGKLDVVDISIPSNAVDRVGINFYLTSEEMIRCHMRPRSANSHKGTYGKCLIVAGSRGMTGAGLMAASAALKSGCGISSLAVPEDLQPLVEGRIPEIITYGFSKDSHMDLPKLAESCQSLAVGPGMGNSQQTRTKVETILLNCRIPIVLDADGLNAIADFPGILAKAQGSVIITPHPGEMARLLGCTTAEIQKDRPGCAQKAAKAWNIIVVLKGFRTIIATPSGKLYVNPTGNPGMATAGSGDVLCGVVSGLLAQGLSPEAAAVSGTWIHGAAGDAAMKKIGSYGLTAGDILSCLPHTIKQMIV